MKRGLGRRSGNTPEAIMVGILHRPFVSNKNVIVQSTSSLT